MSAPILITVPKYVAISPSPVQKSISPGLAYDTDTDNDSPKGRKRRLDHLTWEEKIQRKKLKNRVAAQTSRDRKKAKMDEMEYTVKLLSQKTDMLQNKCDSLQSINESLLNKNRKLDQQVEELQKQLEELQKQQTEIQNNKKSSIAAHECTLKMDCVDSNSINMNRSAEGNGIQVDPMRLQRQFSSSMEDNSSMPALQDLLEDFDASKLEELAESLLADIQADMERSSTPSNNHVTENASGTKQLSGSMVGTTTELMESCEDSCLSIKTENDVINKITDDTIADPEMLYGTYDEKTNSITVVLPDGNISHDEAVEEIVSEEEQLAMDDDDDDEEFDPVKEFLTPKEEIIQAKSPFSTHSISDYGYESIGSPQSDSSGLQFNDLWDHTFTELFPSLV